MRFSRDQTSNICESESKEAAVPSQQPSVQPQCPVAVSSVGETEHGPMGPMMTLTSAMSQVMCSSGSVLPISCILNIEQSR